MGEIKNIFECVVSDINGVEGNLRYYATESEVNNRDFNCKVYGIRVENEFNGIIKNHAELNDITSLYDEIIILTKKMARGIVTPISVFDIVEDFVNRNN